MNEVIDDLIDKWHSGTQVRSLPSYLGMSNDEYDDYVVYNVIPQGWSSRSRAFVDLRHNYDIIYADPPWQYNDKASAGKRGAEYKYPVMSFEDIANLPVQTISADDCALFLWVTAPFMDRGIELVRRWGFEYKTVAFTWIKKNKVADSLFWGMGNWTRANPEYVLLGVKGKPKRVDKGVHSVVEAKVGRHSAKPVEVRTRIERLMCANTRQVELFARETPRLWDAWGNEIPEEDYRHENRAR